jgi:peptidoglycan/xylan/chitin deacetylase (PgdA/CDA1 family)
MNDSDHSFQMPLNVLNRRYKIKKDVLRLQVQRMFLITFISSFLFGFFSLAKGDTSVALWQGDKKGAVSITFDDGLASQFTYAFPLLQAQGLRATFFIVTNYIGYLSYIDEWDLGEYTADGQEIGSHTESHHDLTKLKTNQLYTELSQSQLMLHDLTGQEVAALAYPFGSYDSTVIAATDDFYIAARTANSNALNASTPNFYELNVIWPNEGGTANVIPYLQSWVDSAVAENKWMIEMFHDIEIDGYDTVSSEDFGTHIDYLVANESDLWVAPMGVVAEYIYERNAAWITTLVSNQNLIQLDLQCGLDSRFNTPLTLLTLCPPGWESGEIHVQQDSSVQVAELVSKDDNLYIIYDAIPDAGIIEISPASLPISASAGSTGTIDPNGIVFADYGSDLVFTATPDSGYEVNTWIVDGNEVQTGGQEYTLTNITASHTVEVTFKPVIYIISGYCLEPDGITPVEGVLIQSDADANDVSDVNGYYELRVDQNWSGTVTPQKEGYVFDPNGDEYMNVTENYMDANYTASLITFTISGYIFEQNFVTPISDVNVVAEEGGGPWTRKYLSGTNVTDANGLYALIVDYNWSGIVMPTRYAYAFEPNQMQFINVLEDKNDQNYIGELMSFAVSGYILNDCGTPINNVTVVVSNGVNQVTTDPNGFYEVWVPYNWSGTATPSKVNYTFTPSEMVYFDVFGSHSEQNYLAENSYDLDCDGFLGSGDLGIFAENWLGGPDLPGDFYKDEYNIINFLDFADFSNVWLIE